MHRPIRRTHDGARLLGEREGEVPSLVPDALSACSTAGEARQLAAVLALDALDEALSVRIDVRRLIGAIYVDVEAIEILKDDQDLLRTQYIVLFEVS